MRDNRENIEDSRIKEGKVEEELRDQGRMIPVESPRQPIEEERRKQTALQGEPEQKQISKYSNEDFDNVFKQLLSISEVKIHINNAYFK